MSETLRFINENTSLPFKVVIPIIASLLGATVWIQSTLGEIRTAQREAISRAEITAWRNALAERNRSMDVPYLETTRKN